MIYYIYVIDILINNGVLQEAAPPPAKREIGDVAQ